MSDDIKKLRDRLTSKEQLTDAEAQERLKSMVDAISEKLSQAEASRAQAETHEAVFQGQTLADDLGIDLDAIAVIVPEILKELRSFKKLPLAEVVTFLRTDLKEFLEPLTEAIRDLTDFSVDERARRVRHVIDTYSLSESTALAIVLNTERDMKTTRDNVTKAVEERTKK